MSTMLTRLKQRFTSTKVPLRQQMADVDCGVTCLAMILEYFGADYPVNVIRLRCEQFGPAQTTTAIIKGARSLGLEAKMLAVDFPTLGQLRLPAILHWNFNHFVVLERIQGDTFTIADPALGRSTLSRDEFGKCFTGIAISLSPGAAFVPEKQDKTLEFKRYLKENLLTPACVRQVGKVMFFSLCIQLLALAYPLFSHYLVDVILPIRQADLMSVLLLMIGMFFVSVVMTAWLRGIAIAQLHKQIDTALLNGFVCKLLRLPTNFFLERSSGEINSRAMSNSVIRDTLSNATLSASLDTIMLLFNLGTLFWLNMHFALVTIGLSLIQVVSYVVYARSLRDPVAAETKAQAVYFSYLNEMIHGILTIKANAAESHVEHKWGVKLGHYMSRINLRNQVEATHTAISNGLRLSIPAFLLWYSGTLYIQGACTLGEILAMNAIAAMVFGPLSSLANLVRSYQDFRIHGERMGELWQYANEQTESHTEEIQAFGDISLENVAFRYRTSSQTILNGCSLTIHQGSHCAIVGPSGSGKTTLVSLLLGFQLPTEGTVRYNGIPLDSIRLDSLRSRIGYVTQQNYLFNGSIRSNIALARPDAPLSEIEWAAEVAGLLQDIRHMPLGFDTNVGEGGAALSGGQKQRLAIARAILSRPEILILDEATSNLDAETEARVIDALASISATQIWITHRLSSLKHCDQIYIMNQGRIVASGTSHELAESNDFFKNWRKRELSNQETTA
ncbi:peptidase domain-containing ABC transporter [Burkholderiaceae bacterium DAT-1]|nr:peptidase domain-containing ABC transporter [Burkholderiaceae bacterium DAT-1]